MHRNKVEERPTAVCKLQKGEAIVFDYEGKFSKRRENNVQEFKYSNL